MVNNWDSWISWGFSYNMSCFTVNSYNDDRKIRKNNNTLFYTAISLKLYCQTFPAYQYPHKKTAKSSPNTIQNSKNPKFISK